MLLVLFLGFLGCLVIKSVLFGLSYFYGWLIGYLNFRSAKNDGISTLIRVRSGLEPGKGVFLYMSKFYIRLLATGILLFLGMALLKLKILPILLGIVAVYTTLVLTSFVSFYFRKLEIV